MPSKIHSITAIGTRGKVKGKPFLAVPRDGTYVLHSDALAAKSGKPLRYAVNQIRVTTLEEVARLLASGGYRVRVYNAEHNQWNMRMPSEVNVLGV